MVVKNKKFLGDDAVGYLQRTIETGKRELFHAGNGLGLGMMDGLGCVSCHLGVETWWERRL